MWQRQMQGGDSEGQLGLRRGMRRPGRGAGTPAAICGWTPGSEASHRALLIAPCRSRPADGNRGASAHEGSETCGAPGARRDLLVPAPVRPFLQTAYFFKLVLVSLCPSPNLFDFDVASATEAACRVLSSSPLRGRNALEHPAAALRTSLPLLAWQVPPGIRAIALRTRCVVS